MLDINFIRQNKNQVKEACSNKNLDPFVIDQLLQVDEERRSSKGNGCVAYGE